MTGFPFLINKAKNFPKEVSEIIFVFFSFNKFSCFNTKRNRVVVVNVINFSFFCVFKLKINFIFCCNVLLLNKKEERNKLLTQKTSFFTFHIVNSQCNNSIKIKQILITHLIINKIFTKETCMIIFLHFAFINSLMENPKKKSHSYKNHFNVF